MAADPRWLKLALAEVGVSEIAGPKANKRIVEFLNATSLPDDMIISDETPWCAAFMAWVFKMCGVKAPTSARALDWVDWPTSTAIDERTKIKRGDVLIFKRPAGGKGAGHIGIFTRWWGGERSDHDHPDDEGDPRTAYPVIVGGNQGDAVTEDVCKLRLVAVRRPQQRKPIAKSRAGKAAVATGAAIATTTTAAVVEAVKQANDVVVAGKPAIDALVTWGPWVALAVLGVAAIGGVAYMLWLDRGNGKNGK